jgi:hypothetical protein
MILSIQLKYTMKMEAVSDSSQREQKLTLLITLYFPDYIYEDGTVYISHQQQHKKKE